MQTEQIKFDAPTHKYTVGNREVMSVTTILKEAGMIDTQWFTEESRLRGTAVHEAVFYDIHNDLHEDGMHDIIRPYVQAWFKFKNDTDFLPLSSMCEARMYHPIYEYAGTPDLIGRLNGRMVLIDIKTGDCPTARFQTAAYREFPKVRALSPARFSLRLFNDGKYKCLQHSDPNDFLVFLDALKKVRENKGGILQ